MIYKSKFVTIHCYYPNLLLTVWTQEEVLKHIIALPVNPATNHLKPKTKAKTEDYSLNATLNNNNKL